MQSIDCYYKISRVHECLSTIGSISNQLRVLEAWELIELDEPLIKRRKIIEDNISKQNLYWNVYVAISHLAHTMLPSSYLEVGVRTCGSLVQALYSRSIKRVIAIDLWLGKWGSSDNLISYAKDQVNNFKKSTGRTFSIDYVKTDSYSALKRVVETGEIFDLITIDGNHSREVAIKDLKLCKELLSENGAIIFDDIMHSAHLYLYKVVMNFLELNKEFRVILNTIHDNGCAVLFRRDSKISTSLF